jgi:hypothetical protein
LLTGLVGKATELDLLISAAVGTTGRLISRKLHFLVRRVAVGEFALPERMQQNCIGYREFHLIY